MRRRRDRCRCRQSLRPWPEERTASLGRRPRFASTTRPRRRVCRPPRRAAVKAASSGLPTANRRLKEQTPSLTKRDHRGPVFAAGVGMHGGNCRRPGGRIDGLRGQGRLHAQAQTTGKRRRHGRFERNHRRQRHLVKQRGIKMILSVF